MGTGSGPGGSLARTLPDGGAPPIRPRPPRYERRINYVGGPEAHALPAIDALWLDGGTDNRTGFIELHFDARDFSGVSISADMDFETGDIIVTVRPNTAPLPPEGRDTTGES